MCMCVCTGTLVEVRDEFTALGSIILSCGFWGLDCGYYAWRQAHSSTQPSHWSRNFFSSVKNI